MNKLFTPYTVEILLRELAADAGHEAAVVRTMTFWDPVVDGISIGFHITSAEGTKFDGFVPASWRFLTTSELMEKLIEKYPLAFAPKHAQAQLVEQKIESAIARALEAVEVEAARVAIIALREATK